MFSTSETATAARARVLGRDRLRAWRRLGPR
jgi:hypothetical protein